MTVKGGMLLMTGVLAALISAGAHADSLRPVKKIGFVNPVPAYPVFQEADRCFREAIKAAGIEGETSGPTGLAFDNQFNLDRMSQYMATGADGIIVVPIDGPMYTPIIEQAKSKGIYVAALNTGFTTTAQHVVLGTDYGNQGQVIAENLAKRGGQQNVVIIGNTPSGVHKQFVDGFIAGAQKMSNVKFVDQGFDQSDPAQTADVASRLMTAHPEVNVVLSWEGIAVAGIVTAIKEKKMIGKVVGVTNDITPEVVAGMNEGTIYATSKQNFCAMAKGAVDAIIALSKGQPVPKSIDTGIIFVTKDNLAKEAAN